MWVKLNKVPFNYIWPSRAQTVWRKPGKYNVKQEVATAMIEQGYAEPTDAEKATYAEIAATEDGDGKAADHGRNDQLDGEDLAAADRAGGGDGVDQGAE